MVERRVNAKAFAKRGVMQPVVFGEEDRVAKWWQSLRDVIGVGLMYRVSRRERARKLDGIVAFERIYTTQVSSATRKWERHRNERESANIYLPPELREDQFTAPLWKDAAQHKLIEASGKLGGRDFGDDEAVTGAWRTESVGPGMPGRSC